MFDFITGEKCVVGVLNIISFENSPTELSLISANSNDSEILNNLR